MRPRSLSRRRPAAAVAVGLLVLVATGVAVSWNRGRTLSTAVPASISQPPVIAITWRGVGQNVEPWSGVGLGQQVRQALNARGVVVTDDSPKGIKSAASGPETLAELGRRLNATYVLGGTVGRKGERSEIGMQLIRVQDGAPVWSSTFWRAPTDLHSLATDLAVAVSQVLEAETSGTSDLP